MQSEAMNKDGSQSHAPKPKATAQQLCVFIVLTSALISIGCAQEQRPEEAAQVTSSQRSQPPDAVPPAPLRLDNSATALPERFTGHDIERVYQSLHTSGRSEFETTEAYRKRLSDEADASVYHFIVEPKEIVYDADKGEMELRLWVKVDPSTTDIDEDSAMLPVRNKVERTTFPASNAFGVQVQVQRTSETAYGLAAVKVPATLIGQRVLSALYDGRYQSFVEIRLPMTPEEAQRRKQWLRFLYRARPSINTKSRTYSDNYEWKATIDSPTSRVTESFGVYVDVSGLGVWVVDLSQRDVLRKTTFAELLKMKQ